MIKEQARFSCALLHVLATLHIGGWSDLHLAALRQDAGAGEEVRRILERGGGAGAAALERRTDRSFTPLLVAGEKKRGRVARKVWRW